MGGSNKTILPLLLKPFRKSRILLRSVSCEGNVVRRSLIPYLPLQSLNEKILDPLYRLIARALELPEDYLVNLHRFDAKGEDHLRYMKYTHYSEKDTRRIGNLWTKGHTDLGSITLLYAQSVAA